MFVGNYIHIVHIFRIELVQWVLGIDADMNLYYDKNYNQASPLSEDVIDS